MDRIDLNADVGESFGAWSMGDDGAMLDLVSSANIACGFHAGDPYIMRLTVQRAIDRRVVIGAHVAYRDLAGFGRRFVDVDPPELTADVLYQLAALDGLCRSAGTRVAYVKPHGALYNAVVHHEAQAAAVLDAVAEFDPSLPVLCLPGSLLLRQAEDRDLHPVPEAFADRAYYPDGSLVSRRLPGAVLRDPATVAARMLRLIQEGVVAAVDGSDVSLTAASICIHGDTPSAVALARAVREALTGAGCVVAPFAA